jgi:hypothetical protein
MLKAGLGNVLKNRCPDIGEIFRLEGIADTLLGLIATGLSPSTFYLARARIRNRLTIASGKVLGYIGGTVGVDSGV